MNNGTPMNNQALLLDTHIWIWFSLGDAQLSKKVSQQINQAIQEGNICISAISLWELAMLESKKKITLAAPCLEWIKKNLHELRLRVIPLIPEIVVDSCSLPDGFHADPADRLIIATARVENLTLISKDSAILSYGKQGHLAVQKPSKK
jgi:PIN domain nuclease of toxin-antitoxin system